MNPLCETPSPALLPTGFVDLLPGEAEAEARGISRVMEVFSRHGYERVSPPLLEFESFLLGGSGKALADQTFRLMDPMSHRMMALRPDMTTQVARIAGIRLQDMPRPLRLSYSGDCVVVGVPGRESQRQVSQAGIELIGPDCAQADAEIVALGAEALSALGIEGVSFDLSMPALVWALIDAAECAPRRESLIHALDRRDAGAVAAFGGSSISLLLEMMEACGPVDRALSRLSALSFPDSLSHYVTRLRDCVEVLKRRMPGLRLTVDPVDFRGWQYHTGLCVTVFAIGSREELGRGGRYLAGEEPACGLTLRPQALLRAAPALKRRPRCYVPPELAGEILRDLHEAGYVTVSALEPDPDPAAAARFLRCSHVWQEGTIRAV